ncbi:MAG: hypothetical protein ACXACI_17630 [Candidatus Hodarchaeales archaeon]|jgi:hypothetical protein
MGTLYFRQTSSFILTFQAVRYVSVGEIIITAHVHKGVTKLQDQCRGTTTQQQRLKPEKPMYFVCLKRVITRRD